MIVALLNPHANRQSAAHLASVLTTESARLRLEVSERPEDVPRLLDRVLSLQPELLVVAGGDGTLLNVLTSLDEMGTLDAAPPILVLPAGALNVTATTLVGVGSAAGLAAHILPAWTRGVRRIRRLPVLSVRIDDGKPTIGVTASFGAIGRLHRAYEEQPRRGPLGVASVLGSLVHRHWIDGTFRAVEGPFVTEPPIGAGPHLAHRDITAGLASALPRFFLGMTPFPHADGVAVDGFHTLLSSLGPLQSRTIFSMVWRSGQSHPGLASGMVRRLTWVNSPYPDVVALDGEIIPVPPRARVEIAVRCSVRVVAWTMLRTQSEPTS